MYFRNIHSGKDVQTTYLKPPDFRDEHPRVKLPPVSQVCGNAYASSILTKIESKEVAIDTCLKPAALEEAGVKSGWADVRRLSRNLVYYKGLIWYPGIQGQDGTRG